MGRTGSFQHLDHSWQMKYLPQCNTSALNWTLIYLSRKMRRPLPHQHFLKLYLIGPCIWIIYVQEPSSAGLFYWFKPDFGSHILRISYSSTCDTQKKAILIYWEKLWFKPESHFSHCPVAHTCHLHHYCILFYIHDEEYRSIWCTCTLQLLS